MSADAPSAPPRPVYTGHELRRGVHVISLPDVGEIATVTFLDSVTDQLDRIREFCAGMARVDARRAETEAQITFGRLGWDSRAEHDAEWARLVARTEGQPDDVRAYLNDRWRLDARQLPLTRDEMADWARVMDTVITPQPEPVA